MDQQVLQNLIESAKEVYPDSEIMQRVVVTQGIHESGMHRPRGASQLAIRCNNLFGIKGKGNAGSKSFPTWEHIDGKDIQVQADFAAYLDHQSCFEAHRNLMNKKRYAPVLASETVSEAFVQLRLCGYATDRNYSVRLQQVYDSIVREAFND